MTRLFFILVFCFFATLKAEFTYNDLLSDFPKEITLTYSGYKYLVGKLVFTLHIKRETKNYMVIKSEEKAYILGIRAHKSAIDTVLSLKDFKPSETIYWDYRKKKMRFNFFFENFYRYIRITNFDKLIDIDREGKIISPKGFNPKDHDIKRSKHDFSGKNTLVFDPNLILIALPTVDKKLLSKLDKMELVFTTMDHVIPFKIFITKETDEFRYLTLEYKNKKADEMQLLFRKIIVDKKKKLLKRVSGSEKHVGEVYIELK